MIDINMVSRSGKGKVSVHGCTFTGRKDMLRKEAGGFVCTRKEGADGTFSSSLISHDTTSDTSSTRDDASQGLTALLNQMRVNKSDLSGGAGKYIITSTTSCIFHSRRHNDSCIQTLKANA